MSDFLGYFSFTSICLARQWIDVLYQYLALDEFRTIFYVDVDSARSFSLFSRRIEKVLSRCFDRVRAALLALGFWTLFLRRFVAAWWFEGDGHFCCIFAAFSGSSSELSPRVSAQALALV